MIPMLEKNKTWNVVVPGETVIADQPDSYGVVSGQIIDRRYKIVREIGRGSIGVVYEVTDMVLNRNFAIKRLLPQYLSNPRMVETFKREGINAISFSSESRWFVTTRYVGEDELGNYLVMDYVADQTLRQVLDSSPHGRLGVERAMKIFADLAEAVGDLHRLRFIHRDLKPANIFIPSEGSGGNLRIVDFGLALDFKNGIDVETPHGGTLGYISPEQRKGNDVTHATDIYALGVIGYEILTGELPSIGDSLSSQVPNLPRVFHDVIMECLSRDAESRPISGSLISLRLQYANAADNRLSSKPLSDMLNISDTQSRVELHFGSVDGHTITVSGIRALGNTFVLQQTSAQPFVKVKYVRSDLLTIWKIVKLHFQRTQEVKKPTFVLGIVKKVTVLKAHRMRAMQKALFVKPNPVLRSISAVNNVVGKQSPFCLSLDTGTNGANDSQMLNTLDQAVNTRSEADINQKIFTGNWIFGPDE